MNVFVLFAFVSSVTVVCDSIKTPSSDIIRGEDCYAQEKIYDRNTNQCYKLLTRGPCPKGQWFVLQKPANDGSMEIEAKCVKENCKDGEYYWSETRTCVKAEDSENLCDVNVEKLQYNVFGEGECACTREPPRARLHNDRDNRCFTLYTQGPCSRGKVLGFRNSSTDEASCITDPCYNEARYRGNGQRLSSDAVLAQWKDGRCYELDTQGPCPKGSKFKVHSEEKRPMCTILYNAIFTSDTGNCDKDLNGDCQKKVTKKDSANKYLTELNAALEQARKRRSS